MATEEMAASPMLKRVGLKTLDYLRKPVHYYRTSQVDMAGIRSVCMGWGPNRNMTTMTASLIALHPNCQVLNNAGFRQMDRAEALLQDPTPSEFERFVRTAIFKSQGGKRGSYGGTITVSHAFDRPAMRDPYLRRYGHNVMREDIRCVYWKSSVQLTAVVRGKGIDIDRAVELHQGIRFLMPFRSPLDCAKSNLRLGHYKHFPEIKDQPIEKIVAFFVQLQAEFLDHRAKHPANFFCYFEKDFGRDMLVGLAEFLGVPADEQWLEDCMLSQPRGTAYDYEPSLLAAFEEAIEEHMGAHPEMAAKLRSLAS